MRSPLRASRMNAPTPPRFFHDEPYCASFSTTSATSSEASRRIFSNSFSLILIVTSTVPSATLPLLKSLIHPTLAGYAPIHRANLSHDVPHVFRSPTSALVQVPRLPHGQSYSD